MNTLLRIRAARILPRALTGAFSLLLLPALATSGRAQPASGGITGQVYNQATNEYLDGADVKIVGTDIDVQTSTGGTYDLPNIPAGSVQLQISYSGLDTKTETIEVTAGPKLHHDVALTSQKMYGDVVKLSSFVVAGELEGEAKAIVAQKNAPNQVDVIDSDTFPNVAGGSIGNFLQNVPGISIGFSVADPRTISVRGMDPSMNSVTVNGMRASSASSGNANRQFEIDQISMQDIASVEVTRTARPDQDADSGGGNVNLVSKNAFAQKGMRVSYAVNFNGDSDVYSLHGGLTNDGPDRAPQIRPGANFSFSNSYFDNKLGVVFTANDFEFYTISPSTKMALTNVSTVFGIDPSAPSGVYTSQFQIANGASFTRRHGVSLNLDFRLSDNTVLFANNQVNTSYIRSAGRGQSFTATAPTTNTATTTNSVAPGYSDTFEVARGDAVSNVTTTAGSTSATEATLFSGDLLNKTGAGTNFSAGSKTHIDTPAGAWNINFTASSSLSTNQYDLGPNNPVGGSTFFLRGLTYSLNSPPNSHYPVVTQLAGPDYNNLSNYVSNVATTSTSSVDGLTYKNPNFGPMAINNTRESHAMDRLDEGRLDIEHDFVTKFMPFNVQIGAEMRHEYRDIDNNGREMYVYSGPTNIDFGQFAETTFQKQNILAYKSPPFPSLTAIQQFFFANPQDFTKNSIYEIQARNTGLRHLFEAVNSAYAESNIKIIPKLNLLIGVRLEQTIDKASGPVTNNANGLINPATGTAYTDPVAQTNAIYGKFAYVRTQYRNYFPNIQLKYDVTPDLVVRLAHNFQMARQQMGNIIPGVSVSTTTPAIVTVNNPNLAPILFSNYDASLEYYFSSEAGTGKFTIDGYYKKLRNYTVSVVTPIQPGVDYNVGVDTSQFPGGSLVEVQNVGLAREVGAEVDYSQQLGGLNPILRGFSIYANWDYTFGESNTTYMATGVVSAPPANSKLPIVNVYPHQINAGITYTRDPFFASIKMNKWSADPTSVAAAQLAYNEARTTCDVYFSYRFYKNNSIYVDARDVFNAPLITYIDVPYRTSSYTLFGSQWNVGIKGTF